MIPLIVAQRAVQSIPVSDPGPDLGVEELPLERAQGRILAVAPASDRDLPPFDRVTMDGFAVRASEVRPDAPLRIVGALAAGAVASRALQSGEALRVMTGTPLPEGADAVVPVELATVQGERVLFTRTAQPGANVHTRGVDVRAGERPLAAGARITPAAIPLLATLGCRRVTVYRRPRVALLATGDELVEPDVVPSGGQIRESNRATLAAQVTSAGGEPTIAPIVRDERERIRAAVQSALDHDVVVVTGGSSAGDYDFSKEVMTALGAQLRFEQVAIKPGKPVLLFTLGRTSLFCLPGNPVSSFVTFEVLVRPLLERLGGARATWPVPLELPLAARLAAPPERDLLQVARLVGTERGWSVEPLRWSGSGDVVTIARANALAHLARGRTAEAGAAVRVLPLASSFDDLPRTVEPTA